MKFFFALFPKLDLKDTMIDPFLPPTRKTRNINNQREKER